MQKPCILPFTRCSRQPIAGRVGVMHEARSLGPVAVTRDAQPSRDALPSPARLAHTHTRTHPPQKTRGPARITVRVRRKGVEAETPCASSPQNSAQS